MDDDNDEGHGYTISSPCEPDGSGELKICKIYVCLESEVYDNISSYLIITHRLCISCARFTHL